MVMDVVYHRIRVFVAGCYILRVGVLDYAIAACREVVVVGIRARAGWLFIPGVF